MQVALNAYADVQCKHEELIRLETSIREVQQLFMDMAILVQDQGELLDNVEDFVSYAVNVRVCVCVCVCVCMFMYVCMYLCMYMECVCDVCMWKCE